MCQRVERTPTCKRTSGRCITQLAKDEYRLSNCSLSPQADAYKAQFYEIETGALPHGLSPCLLPPTKKGARPATTIILTIAPIPKRRHGNYIFFYIFFRFFFVFQKPNGCWIRRAKTSFRSVSSERPHIYRAMHMIYLVHVGYFRIASDWCDRIIASTDNGLRSGGALCGPQQGSGRVGSGRVGSGGFQTSWVWSRSVAVTRPDPH